MDVSPESLAVIGKMVGGAWALKEVAKPTLERLGQELESFLLGPRRERAAALLNEAAGMLKDAESLPQPVPGRILMPILEYGSWEDEPNLQKRWAALLANAASSNESNQVLPAFIEILRQLTPVHAHFIDLAWKHQDSRPGELVSDDLLKDGLFLAAGQSGRRQFELIATDLLRLRVIDGVRWLPPMTEAQKSRERDTPQQVYRMTSTTDFERFRVTSLGVAFIRACTPPNRTP